MGIQQRIVSDVEPTGGHRSQDRLTARALQLRLQVADDLEACGYVLALFRQVRDLARDRLVDDNYLGRRRPAYWRARVLTHSASSGRLLLAGLELSGFANPTSSIIGRLAVSVDERGFPL